MNIIVQEEYIEKQNLCSYIISFKTNEYITKAINKSFHQKVISSLYKQEDKVYVLINFLNDNDLDLDLPICWIKKGKRFILLYELNESLIEEVIKIVESESNFIIFKSITKNKTEEIFNQINSKSKDYISESILFDFSPEVLRYDGAIDSYSFFSRERNDISLLFKNN